MTPKNFKRLSKTNEVNIVFHLIKDGKSQKFTTVGKSQCDAFNLLMDSLNWEPFVIEYMYEE